MSNPDLTDEEIHKTNLFYSEKLEEITEMNLESFGILRDEIKFTFEVTIILYTILFSLGAFLISLPILTSFKIIDISIYTSIFGGALGLTDIALLFAFKPVEKIHDLMGDMSQISMAINSYQQQVALRIIQYNIKNRDSIDHTATEINKVTKETTKLIQQYVETKEKNSNDEITKETMKMIQEFIMNMKKEKSNNEVKNKKDNL